MIIKKSRGFTLLEILVVIMIVSIISTFALLAFGDFGKGRQVIVAAEQFAEYIELIQQQAILEMATFGIRCNQQTYQAVRLDQQGHWNTIEKTHHVFKPQHFPAATQITWQGILTSANTPQIIIYPSGDTQPFSVVFGYHIPLAKVSASYNGNILFKVLADDKS